MKYTEVRYICIDEYTFFRALYHLLSKACSCFQKKKQPPKDKSCNCFQLQLILLLYIHRGFSVDHKSSLHFARIGSADIFFCSRLRLLYWWIGVRTRTDTKGLPYLTKAFENMRDFVFLIRGNFASYSRVGMSAHRAHPSLIVFPPSFSFSLSLSCSLPLFLSLSISF